MALRHACDRLCRVARRHDERLRDVVQALEAARDGQAASLLAPGSGIRGISTSPPRYARVSASVEATTVAPASRSKCVLSSASAGGPQRPTMIRTSGNAAWSLLTR